MAGIGPRALDLPPEFIRHNDQDSAWLSALPDLIADLAARWSLTLAPHYPGIAYNYVAPATRADGTPCVLKVSRHVEDTENEVAALRLWDGDCAARLLENDPESSALLIERVEPGTMLVELAESDDEAATVIAASILHQLWRPVPDNSGLRSLEDWCRAYDTNREALSRGDRGFPAALFRRADATRRDLLASTDVPTVLHGDLHHFNILRARRAPWLAIDPKGLSGDRHFDVCQFFRNPHAYVNPREVPIAFNRRRLDIFGAELGLDRERTRAWCFVHAILDACWDYEDGNSWDRTVAYALETESF